MDIRSSHTSASASRVVAIALDAAELRFVERLIDDGELPNLRDIRARSARIELQNDALYRGTSVWNAFVSDCLDGLHADACGFEFDAASYTSRRARAPGAVPFYERADGVVPITIDVPHLPPVGRGTKVCGWGGHIGGPDRGSVPLGLLDELDERFGVHPAHEIEHVYAWHRPDHVRRLAADLAEGARRRVEMTRWLQRQIPDWNFLLVAMSEAHSAGENFGHSMDEAHPLANLSVTSLARQQLVVVYRAIDDAVGALAASLPDDVTLVVFSLHGMTLNDADLPSQALLPELLFRMQGGRGHWKEIDQAQWQLAGCPPVVPAPGVTWAQHLDGEWKGRRPGRPNRVKRIGRQLMPESTAKAWRHLRARARDIDSNNADPAESIRSRRVDGEVPCWYRGTWPTMRAFALPSFSDSRVRINLQGRERHGVVPREEYGRVCGDVESWVRACRDVRTGQTAVHEVVFARAGDPFDPEGLDADIVIRWLPGVDAIEHPTVGIVGPFPFRRTGGHTTHGFAWMTGPGIQLGPLGERPASDLPSTFVKLIDGHGSLASLGRGR